MLTRTETTALEFIAGHIRDSGGISPSYNEIQAATGIHKSRIGFVLDDLVYKGRLRRLGKRARALEVIDASPRSKPVMRLGNAQFYKWDDEAQKLVPWSR